MRTFLFLAVICFVVASILMETDASPQTNTKNLKNGPSSSGNAEPNAGLTLQNQWDPDARDEDLALSESNQIVQNNGMEMGWRSVFAEQPISKNLYYEVKVLNIGYNISIGLATKEMPLKFGVGEIKGSYGYDDNGTLWADAAEGMNQLKEELSVKMEQYQNKQQHNIDAFTEAQKGNGLMPQQNRWDSAACHDKLTLIEPNGLIVQLTGNDLEFCSVFAERPSPNKGMGIFYYEVNILEDGAYDIFIGLATKEMALHKCIGYYEGTYAYASHGTFWGHAVKGCSHWDRRPYIVGKPKIGAGEVIGCGVNLATRQIIYTKNGRLLKTTGLFVDSAAELFPCLTLFHPGDKIEANFGPNFEYKF